jgi:hypothetical protein
MRSWCDDQWIGSDDLENIGSLLQLKLVPPLSPAQTGQIFGFWQYYSTRCGANLGVPTRHQVRLARLNHSYNKVLAAWNWLISPNRLIPRFLATFLSYLADIKSQSFRLYTVVEDCVASAHISDGL